MVWEILHWPRSMLSLEFGHMHEVLDNPLERHNQDTPGAAHSGLSADPKWIAPTVALVSAIFIYLQTFVLPATPRLATGDQGIYLHDATRMLNGEMIYRDYDHFTLPGTDVLYVALFQGFGVRAWIPQLILVILGLALVWLVLSISKKLMHGRAAYLPALLFVTLPFSSYLDATHHWYSLVAILGALAAMLEERTCARLACAGTLLGVATFFTQSMALVTVGFALFLRWEGIQSKRTWKTVLHQEVSLLAGFLGTISACLVYFVWKVGFTRIVYYTVIFVAKYYPADWFNNWRVYLAGRPQLHDWNTWLDIPAFGLIHLIVPFFYILFPIIVRRGETLPRELRSRLMLVYVTGVVLFLTVASAPAYTRLYVVSAPALILIVWYLDSSSDTSRPRTSRLPLRLAWTLVILMMAARPLATQFRWRQILDLPTGRTAFFDRLPYEKCKWLALRTQPSDYFFGDHLIAFALGLRNAGPVPFLRPTEYTRPEEVAAVMQGLENHQVRFVSWYIGLEHERYNRVHPEGDHLAPMRLYLKEHYHVAQTFSNGDQIWERNP